MPPVALAIALAFVLQEPPAGSDAAAPAPTGETGDAAAAPPSEPAAEPAAEPIDDEAVGPADPPIAEPTHEPAAEPAVDSTPVTPPVPVAQYPDPAPDPGPDAVALAPGAPPPPEPPRVLTTLYGHHPDELAKLRNARGTFTFVPDLQVRTRVGALSEFRIDRFGNQYAEGVEVGGRVRWRPVFGFGRREQVRIVGMIDAANGRWVPRSSSDPVIEDIIDEGQPPIQTDLRAVDPRELYVEWTSRAGQLRVGQMSFTWGLGLVANDGNNMDRFGDMKFGDDGDGSLQERILFGTKPLALTGGPGKDLIVALGADLVYRDPNANLIEGDLAGQGLAVMRWEPAHRPGNWIGAYAVYRRQKNADDGDVYPDDDDLEVGVLDVAGQGFVYARPKLALIGAFEAVTIFGRTTFARGDFDSHRVLQGALAVRAYLGNPKTWLAGFDGGLFSGDANPDDDQINDFSAAPGYTAGLVLFPYYEGWQSARSARLAEDPALLGVPPNGTQYIPTEGAVTNAIYVHPKARYALLERFEVWGGPLLAASAVPLADPYTSRLNGGDPSNALGGRSERRYLGTELDLGARGRYQFHKVWFMVGVQGGVLFPGVAFVDADDAHDGPIWAGWVRAQVRY